jgi:hypothetical protein
MTDLSKMNRDDLLALIASQSEMNSKLLQALEAQQNAKLTFKVSEKGALSVYGLQRMPVTLYVGQWERLFAQRDALAAFIKANNHLLQRKTPASA